MLDTAFYFVLNMSITASVIGLLLMGIRRMRLLPAFGTYLLWGLVLARLVLPFSLSSPLSVFNITGNLIKRVVPLSGQSGGSIPDLTFTNAIGAAESYFPVVYRNELLESVFRVSAIIWAIIAAAALLSAVGLYCLTGSELKKSQLVSGHLYRSDQVATPLTFGMIKPRIIVPESLVNDSAALAHILRHEEIHIRRRDNFWRLLGVGAACIHWFNPLSWLFLRTFFEDMELACDAKAIHTLTPAERRAYAATLLSCQSGKPMVMSTAFGGSRMRVRIENVISYRKLTAVASAGLILFLMAVSLALLTNPIK